MRMILRLAAVGTALLCSIHQVPAQGNVQAWDFMKANERAAVESLRLVASAQVLVREAGAIDEDRDNLGEHGWFAELAGTAVLRGDAVPLDPPLLPPRFGEVDDLGFVEDRGYLFAMFLPGASGRPLREAPGGGSPGGEFPCQAEWNWIAYAWPVAFDVTGRRAFVVNQRGMVMQTDNLRGAIGHYSGTSVFPPGDAAVENGSVGDIGGFLSHGLDPAPPNDGNYWRHVRDDGELVIRRPPYPLFDKYGATDTYDCVYAFGTRAIEGCPVVFFLVEVNGAAVSPLVMGSGQFTCYFDHNWFDYPYFTIGSDVISDAWIGMEFTLRAYALDDQGELLTSNDELIVVDYFANPCD